MHNFTHEYQRHVGKPVEGLPGPITYRYVGSRCSTEGCPEGRTRATLDTVKRHNDSHPGATFRNSRIVTK